MAIDDVHPECCECPWCQKNTAASASTSAPATQKSSTTGESKELIGLDRSLWQVAIYHDHVAVTFGRQGYGVSEAAHEMHADAVRQAIDTIQQQQRTIEELRRDTE